MFCDATHVTAKISWSLLLKCKTDPSSGSGPIQSEAVVDLQDLTLDADVQSALASDEDAPGLLVRRRAGSSSFHAGELSCGTMVS